MKWIFNVFLDRHVNEFKSLLSTVDEWSQLTAVFFLNQDN